MCCNHLCILTIHNSLFFSSGDFYFILVRFWFSTCLFSCLSHSYLTIHQYQLLIITQKRILFGMSFPSFTYRTFTCKFQDCSEFTSSPKKRVPFLFHVGKTLQRKLVSLERQNSIFHFCSILHLTSTFITVH